MKKKYELIDSDKKGLYRIRALRKINGVNPGELGGYVESEANLSKTGICWIYGNAIVSQNAFVKDSAKIMNDAQVLGNATVADKAKVGGLAVVGGNAYISEKATIRGESIISQNAQVFGEAIVMGHCSIEGYAKVYEQALVEGYSSIRGTSSIHGHCSISGRIITEDSADIAGYVQIASKALINGTACIYHIDDFMSIYPVFGNHLFAFKNSDGKIMVSVENLLAFDNIPLEKLETLNPNHYEGDKNKSKEFIDCICKIFNQKFSK